MDQEYFCGTELNESVLSDAMAHFFHRIRPHREGLFDYYHSRQPIPKGEAVRGRPNNLLRVPFPRYITEVHTGYFLGKPLTMAFPSPKAGQTYTALARRLQLDHLLFDVARDMSICGVGFALVWLERSGLKACRCDPLSCFTIRRSRAGAPLAATVRLTAREDGRVEGVLYREEGEQPFVWDGATVHLQPIRDSVLRAPALIPFVNNCDGLGDFEGVCGLVDAYNLLLSGAMDDMQSVANAFLALYGMQGTTQGDIDRANRTRVLSLAEGGKAEFVVKNLNHEALSQLEGNLRRSILQLSMTPDFSDESFAGQASGVALQYKLWGVEQVRAAKERSFRQGLQMLLQVCSAGLSTLGEPVDLTCGQATFYKNLPQNHAEQVEMLLSLSDILSRRTVLEQLPWVEDAEEELRRKLAEKEHKEE